MVLLVFSDWLDIQCSAIGATVAYLISASLGSVVVIRNFGERIANWNEQLLHHRKHMFNYMVVLRISPLPPNWVVNLGAAQLDVPVGAFFWGTFFGKHGLYTDHHYVPKGFVIDFLLCYCVIRSGWSILHPCAGWSRIGSIVVLRRASYLYSSQHYLPYSCGCSSPHPSGS